MKEKKQNNVEVDEYSPGKMFIDKYNELGKLIKFPPFSTNIDTSDAFRDELGIAASTVAESVASARQISDSPDYGSRADAALYQGAFADFEEKWADDIDIARLYMKRFDGDYFTAQEEALSLEGKKPGDMDVPDLD